jgi:predicted RNA-binding Zn-ribbon protein involved in translation (DUF1610 family)
LVGLEINFYNFVSVTCILCWHIENFKFAFGTSGENIYVGSTIFCAAAIATLLLIGGFELNPGPENNFMQVLCSGCDRKLKSGTECESCGQWYHNSCGNVKFQVPESGKWNCDRCRSERLRF